MKSEKLGFAKAAALGHAVEVPIGFFEKFSGTFHTFSGEPFQRGGVQGVVESAGQGPRAEVSPTG